MAIFGHIVTAMVTPFNDKGQIDWDRTEKLIDYLIDTGSEALVVSGTTGESPTLSRQEKLDLFAFSVQKAKGRVKVIAGTGCNDTEESITFSREAAKTGIDAIMLVAPYYSRTSQEGLYQHFKAISEAVELPIMLYNVPGRTGVNMTADTTLRLAELPNVVCIKEASGNLTQMAQIIEHAPQGFELYSGDDGLTIPVLSIGGVGIVSVTSHIIGLEMKEMMDAFFKGDTSRAAALHRQLVPIFEGAFKYPNPTPIKAALNKKGIEVGGVRLPLVNLTAEEASYINEWL
ncbi:4-hydroxy-tetrahydrodipicolinate synthase [Brevibacillus laterosporus]|uniref:4-hydroxy-tetrahydrodipicolinate synthase n=1 Tax=Brevibacillus laterosporus TaxID=1465 RepID=UPI00037D9467|nr:4-hydroxy-tetrahydrodipicolinate synthase [Brevibacillus laterosporus]ATO47896.1 4-hydroxy-tetrahydrodipicolinate synthase [Brevibacillus laterosporus DSM 25]MBG9803775.1 dihydrodipicolinate synthase [Brevibacillus laterosporus]MED2005793.1 4-hydroxy-tetrahydrodipicolinate synthase [Brevibacillus laterosporus]MED4765613.1 4-hydroxy-tetrahydrodipicolinate synthase [Brevibacillus laterosporus]TPH21899.1 4-hydroxy-tetrahydrodipicolinate synthase [Brevibacillus laterosporus]